MKIRMKNMNKIYGLNIDALRLCYEVTEPNNINIIKDKEDKDGGSRTDEFATIEKKPTNPTTDSNAPTTDNTNTAPLKSPKTGE